MQKRLAWVFFVVAASAIASCAQGATETAGGGGDDGGTADGGATGNDAAADVATIDCATTCTGTTPFCDKSTGKCVACLPQNDTCPATTYCQGANGSYQCAPGCKTASDCAASGDGGAHACCNHACVDTTSSVGNCGACGHACGGDGGAAVCCSSMCVDTQSSAANCGACGKACTGAHVTNTTCAMATCGYDTCFTGWGDCDSDKANGCETPTSADPMRCGGCTNVCSTNHVSSPTCMSSVCTGACDTGYGDCNSNKLTDGCETHTDADPQNCGGCGSRCSTNHVTTPTCTAGACTGACDVGFADCNLDKRGDGCEISTATDPLNCGGCGTVCSTANITAACGGGVCNGVCNAGFGDCNANKQTDGCERALTTLTDCGACGVPCAPANASGATCATATCSYAACTAPYQDCDANRANGCESNKNTDNANCGSCGNRCTGNTSCYQGACISNRVLIAASDSASTIQALQTALNGTGAFSVVDQLDISATTPTVAQLQSYSVVLSWAQTFVTAANEQAFYDNLATYYDGGGRVVLALFIVGGYPGGALGRFLQPGNGYMLFNVTTTNGYTSGGALSLGTVYEPASALMSGVSTASLTTGYWSTEPLLAGAVRVADWNNGSPFIVRGQAQGRNRVDLNLWPNTANFGGNVITAVKNALLYQ